LSTLRIDNFGPSAGGTTYSARGIAKAWVTFNGTGTIAVDDSLNIASLTDRGTGLYRTNFTSNFTNADHVDAFACRQDTAADGGDIDRFVNYNRQPQDVGYTDLTVQTGGTTPVDVARIAVMTHGDLA
jgi:hypothetical protein